MNIFTRSDLRELAEWTRPPCVSLAMPTTRGVANEDKKHWKNLVHEAEERLAETERRPAAAALMQPAHALLEDADFWVNASHGLFGFLAPDFSRFHRLPHAPRAQAIVANRFHITPLLPLLMGDGRFFVLVLSQREVRLLEGTRHTIAEVELKGVPTVVDEELLDQKGQRSRTVFTSAGTEDKMGTQVAISRGHGVDIDTPKKGLREFCKWIDRGIHDVLRDEQAPLILAGADTLLPIYREANSYPHLFAEGITGHPDRFDPHHIHEQAWALLQPHFQQNRDRALALYRRLAGTGQTVHDIPLILQAAYDGRLQYLFIADGREQWGTFDTETKQVEVHEERVAGDEDLVNMAATFMLSRKGTVYTIEPAQAADITPMAGIYWLPIGERRSKKVIATTVEA